jgi:HD superfamily phosphohydrolase YqeK
MPKKRNKHVLAVKNVAKKIIQVTHANPVATLKTVIADLTLEAVM